MKSNIVYTSVPEDNNLGEIGYQFCKEHGDDEHGIIPDAEYDLLYDLLGSITSKHASYSDGGFDANFMGSRYVDQIPWITLVADDDADPSLALRIALETMQSTHRPLAISFDYYPDYLMILPPNIVYSTFSLKQLNNKNG